MPFKLIKFDKLLSELKDFHPLEENLSKIIRDVEIEFDFQSLGIFLYDDKVKGYRLKIGRGLTHSYEKSMIFAHDDNLIITLKEKKSLQTSDFQFEHPSSDVLIASLSFHNNFFGFIFVDKKDGKYDDNALSKLCMFASVCSMVINIFQQRDMIEHLVEEEEHTKIYSYPALYKRLEIFLRHSKRYKRNLTLCVFNFDKYQDLLKLYGKKRIRELESEVTKIMKNYIRQTDIIGRSFGNFIIIAMPETKIENSAIPITRIMDKIDEIPLMEEIKYAFHIREISKLDQELSVILEKAELMLLDAMKQGKKLLVIK